MVGRACSPAGTVVGAGVAVEQAASVAVSIVSSRTLKDRFIVFLEVSGTVYTNDYDEPSKRSEEFRSSLIGWDFSLRSG
jgi:threonine/homoserine efflux transporter RhtA